MILIAPKIESVIAAFVTNHEIRSEAGGIFIGSYRGPHVDISDCTMPLPGDIRKPKLFDRKDPGHQTAARKAWRQSHGTDTYVGEWHTHPVDDPVPSGLDLQTWHAIMRRVSEPLVFLIAGRKSIWCGYGQRGEIHTPSALDTAFDHESTKGSRVIPSSTP